MGYRVCAKCDAIVDNRVYQEDVCPVSNCKSTEWLSRLDDDRDWAKLYDQRYRWKPLRWLKDGKRRVDLIIKTKKKHIYKYMNKINLDDKYMVKHLENKIERLKIYQHKTKQIRDIIANEEHYTYKELVKLTRKILYIEKDNKGYRI